MSSPVWSRLIRFIAAEDGQVHLGEPTGASSDDVGLAVSRGEQIVVQELSGSSAWDPTMTRTGRELTVKTLLSPVDPDQAGTLRCIGVNYADHTAELKLDVPDVPSLFLKAPEAISDPNSKILVHPTCQDNQVDREVELAIVIGRKCRDVSEEDALDYVLGVTVANDITARRHQKTSSQWCYGKGFDGFCPLGPSIVAIGSIKDVQDLRLKTTVNGVVKQNSTTKHMIFPVAKIISYLSQGTTLRPGTVVITGTPLGIGIGLNPPEWLKNGDEVVVSVDGVGSLFNQIVYA